MSEQDNPCNQPQSEWHLQDQLFEELLALEPEQRASRLSNIRQESPALADKLSRLLEAAEDDQPTTLLSESTMGIAALDSLGEQQVPTTIGAWNIIQPIGEGGMARVFEASRPVSKGKQRAAIKILSRGINSEWAERNFQHEIEILARLEDPRLSRLIDWGITEQHSPWLAMELVEGQRIDQACDQLKMPVQSRVKVMLQVIRAIAYAHQQLVVHGDIKPSNILLDDSGHVRVLDFGISRLGNSHADKRNESTQAYTPNYASPEQLRNEPLGPASDIFQLGLLLYRLMTGDTPFHNPSGKTEPRLEAIKHWPETQSGWLPDIEKNAAAARSTTVTRLSRSICGDLESIMRTALAHETAERYRSAEAMADDLQRWLEKRPVHAGGIRFRDRVRCFIQRNSLATAAAVSLGVLIGLLVITIIQHNHKLTVERDMAQAAQVRSESMHEFMLNVFGTVDPNMTETRGMTVDEVLIDGADKVRSQFSDDPVTAATLLVDFADLLATRGRLDEAIDAYEHAYSLRSEKLGTGHPETLEILSPRLIEVLISAGRIDEATEWLEKAQSHARQENAIESVHVMIFQSSASAYNYRNQTELAIESNRKAHHLLQQLKETDQPNPELKDDLDLIQLGIDQQYALLLAQSLDLINAEPLLQKNVAQYESRFGREDSRSISVRRLWTAVLNQLGQHERAEIELKSMLQAQKKLYQKPHLQTAYTFGHLANAVGMQGKHQQAIDYWKAAETELLEATHSQHPHIQGFRFGQARELLLAGQCELGRSMLEEIASRTDIQETTIAIAQQTLIETPCPTTEN